MERKYQNLTTISLSLRKLRKQFIDFEIFYEFGVDLRYSMTSSMILVFCICGILLLLETT